MHAASSDIRALQPPAPSSRLLAPGDLVADRYRIEAYLGGGGMASVYRARHVVLEQSVAIKVISPQIRELPGMAQRFLREARAATQLKSEHVARVSDVGTMADGAPYMVMEYLDGCDLAEILDSGKEVPLEDALDFVLQACEALAEVHGLGIVHRDLKPANLFLTRGADGRPSIKLIDFGISRTDSPLSPKDSLGLTQPETVMGSPRYMSPEQMESATKADCRSDIYGVGVVLYELLTHAAPHEGETFLDIYAAATLGPPAPASSLRKDIPKELDDVILRCLRVEPVERYNDVAELARALAPFGPAGSMARAEGITRIYEAAQSRVRDGGASDGLLSTEQGSRVQRRVSSSAHSLRRRRRRRGTFAAAVLVLGALALGGRALYTRGHFIGVMSTASLPTAIVAPLQAAPAAPTTPPAPTTPLALVPPEPAPVAPRVAEPETPPAPAATPKPTTAIVPALPTTASDRKWLPAAPPARTTRLAASTAPSNDESTLFEDSKMKRRAFFPIVAIALAPHAAFAADAPKSSTDPAAAESLFYAARTLMQQQRFAEACPKLEASMRLDPGMGTQFNLADCNEHIGKIASAWAGFLEVAAQAKTSNQAEREKLARKRATSLESRLPKLVIDVSGAPSGLEVKRDGIVVGAAAWGTPIPVDPGGHHIVATAPGRQMWESTVSTPEAIATHVVVPRELATQIATRTAETQELPPRMTENAGSAQRVAGWIIMGAGAVGVGVGAGFGLTSLTKRDESREHCAGDRCDGVGVGLRDDAIRTGNVATIATVAGGVAMAGGLLLVLTAPKGREAPAEPTAKIRAIPTVAMGGGGFTLQGVFR